MRCLPALVLSMAALVAVSCGGGSQSGRQLTSITIAKTVNGSNVQFVATGNFSSAPLSVTPLAADWANGLLTPPNGGIPYSLSTQPYVVDCSGQSGVLAQVEALAPADPNAPAQGNVQQPVTASLAFTCP